MNTPPTTRPGSGTNLFRSVEATVVGTIVEVVGEEFYEEADITLDSTFSEDIELESM
jgi:acyl carrier protein